MLAINANVQSGRYYTFRFFSDGILKVPDGDLISRIRNGFPQIAEVSISNALFSSSTDVVIRLQDGQSGWTVKKVAENLERSMSSGYGNYTFQSAELGNNAECVLLGVKCSLFTWLLIGLAVVAVLASFSNGFGKGLALRTE